MKIGNLLRGAVVLAAVATVLGACNSQSTQAPSAASGGGSAALAISPDRSANLTRDGDTISVGREKSGRQGVILTPGPMLVTLSVEGEGVVVQVRQRRETINVPADGGAYTVMLGEGGANQIYVTSETADNFSVNVTSVVPCGAGVECAPVAGSAAAAAEPAEAAPAEEAPEPLRD